MLVRLLQLAYSGEKAAALAFQGHARSVRDPQEKAMIAKIENDEWVHRRKVGALLDRLGARPLAVREARASVVGHTLSFLCGLAGWFLPMFLAGQLETKTSVSTRRRRDGPRSSISTTSFPNSARWRRSRWSTRSTSTT